ncbi:hypothetical protein CRG98_010364 [Punica granatum]|uniref:CCHC-type domain-containing protein n=1 Tax=Punica granatum TaxID=22663 RepID=A0A2I0KL34_PUNGR|nr:hypothetical protein CRG98_010364 [Punica granatum]
MKYHGGNSEGLVARDRLSEKGSSDRRKSRGRKPIYWNCNEEGHLKRNCPMRRGKKDELSRDVTVAGESYEGGDIITTTACPEIKEKYDLVGTLDKLGYKYKCQGGVVGISKGALVVMKGLLQKSLYVLQGMASTIAFECPASKVKYLESLRDPVTCSGLIRWKSIGYIRMIEGACRRQVEKLGRKGRSEWRLESLRWNNLQARDRQSKQLRLRECYGVAELVVSCDAEVGNTTCRKVSFEVCTIVKLKKPDTLEESKGGLDLSDRTR